VAEFDLGRTDPASLASLLQVGRVWDSQELAVILSHQLDSPVGFDLEGLPAERQTPQLRTLAAANGLLLKSLADLLLHSRPPLDLLVLAKEFAKNCRTHPHSPLPADVAQVLYLASIAAALAKCRQRISQLSDAALREGFRWALGQPWVDPRLRDLLMAADAILKGEGGTAHVG